MGKSSEASLLPFLHRKKIPGSRDEKVQAAEVRRYKSARVRKNSKTGKNPGSRSEEVQATEVRKYNAARVRKNRMMKVRKARKTFFCKKRFGYQAAIKRAAKTQQIRVSSHIFMM
jgi:hypothetical protein